MSSTKNFKKNLVENAKKVKGVDTPPKAELTAGEKYIEERKKNRQPVTEELTLGQRLLQERLEGKPIIETPMIEESAPTPVVSEDVQETAQMISEITESMTNESAHNRITDPQTEEGRVVEYLEAIRINENANKQSLVEQDLQNTPATMAELANLRSVVTRLQTSLTSLGGGGIGYQEVKQMIEDGDYNIDSADLWALEAALENYIDSAIAERLDSANLIGEFTTDDIEEASNLYYTQARFDSAFSDKTTSDLAEGSNLYYTKARFDSDFATSNTYDSATVQGQIDSAIDAIEPFDISTKTTDDVAEGSSNLYYTQARFDSAFGGKTTSNLTEGANLYYTEARVDANFATKTTDDLTEGVSNKYYGTALFDADFSTKSTDSLGEGSNNLYYTDARVTSLVDSAYVQSRVTLEAGVHFKGVVSFADSDAPADPQAGDLYIADSDGIANASWVGIAGTLIEAQHGVVWANADSSWHELGDTSVDTSVYVEKSGDTMTGTLTVGDGTGSPNLVVSTGNVVATEGDVRVEDADGGVYTDNISNSNSSEYVKIYKGLDIKLAVKQLENVSYQAFTYPNSTAATITSSGTNVTLIHKGYVDSADGLRVLKTGGEMTGTLSVDVGGTNDEAAIKILDGATSELTITGKGKMEWSLDGDAIFSKNGKAYFEFKELSNGTPQIDFTSWLRFADTGIQIGPNYGTQISDGFIYMDGSAKSSDSKIELINGAYLATSRIRPSPANFSDGIQFFGDVTFDFGPDDFALKINRSAELVEAHVPVHMKDNKITDLATPTSSNDAANKSYVDALQGHIKVSSMGQPGGITVGGMYYDTYTGALILKVS